MYVETPIVVSSLGVTGLAPQGGAKVVDPLVLQIRSMSHNVLGNWS